MFNLMEIFIPIDFVFWLYIIQNSQHLKELGFFAETSMIKVGFYLLYKSTC